MIKFNTKVFIIPGSSTSAGSDPVTDSGNWSAVANSDFSGNIYTNSTTSTDLIIAKTGSGVQTLSGNINISDADTTESGFLNIDEGSSHFKTWQW